jgi:hypothetical protein
LAEAACNLISLLSIAARLLSRSSLFTLSTVGGREYDVAQDMRL